MSERKQRGLINLMVSNVGFLTNVCDFSQETYEADYSEEKNLDDFYENLDKSQQNVRVKAVVNFKPTNRDELGFQKNDIITVGELQQFRSSKRF